VEKDVFLGFVARVVGHGSVGNVSQWWEKIMFIPLLKGTYLLGFFE
jgi:hypothetical protein